MYKFEHMGWGMGMGPELFAGFWGLAFLFLLWSLFWKGFALWKAARRGDSLWFVIILIINSVGILEILYLYFFSEPKGLLKDTSNTVKGGEKKKRAPAKK